MMERFLAPALVLLLPLAARAATPPVVEHQPALCTLPDKAVSLCAAVSDDGTVAATRLYFRREGEKYYSFVDMTFTGIDYCGTLPAPREGKVKAIEYYVQAIDNEYESIRTSTYRLPVEDVCEFAPVELDEARAGAITVFATNGRQGKNLDGAFVRTGVKFVPARK
ncbi:MAG: hypothetical protein LJF15_01160 [Acidobacteria bacterium]|nr:hypothetical protein [Acidobacteriota bacterium]